MGPHSRDGPASAPQSFGGLNKSFPLHSAGHPSDVALSRLLAAPPKHKAQPPVYGFEASKHSETQSVQLSWTPNINFKRQMEININGISTFMTPRDEATFNIRAIGITLRPLDLFSHSPEITALNTSVVSVQIYLS